MFGCGAVLLFQSLSSQSGRSQQCIDAFTSLRNITLCGAVLLFQSLSSQSGKSQQCIDAFTSLRNITLSKTKA